MKIALTALLLLAAGASHAQVHKCVDAAGKVSYSETPCGAAAKQSQQMLGREATSTYDPYARERTMQSYQRATAISRSINDDAAAQQPDMGGGIIDNGPSGPGGTNRKFDAVNAQRARMAAEQARRNAEEREARRQEAALRAAAEARSIAAGPQRAKITNCTSYDCYDNKGTAYRPDGFGNLQSNRGQTCTPVPGVRGEYTCR